MAQDGDRWDASAFDNFFLLAILLYAVLTVVFAWDLVAIFLLPTLAQPPLELPGGRA